MELSIVVPSFKQAPTIRTDLRRLNTILNTLNISYEIILVIDGDIDGTSKIIDGTPDLEHIRMEILDRNRGKGYALKHGFSKATGNIAGFVDAGGEIDYGCLPIMINLMHFSNADIVIGSKRHSLSIIKYPVIRKIYSIAYQLINKTLFRLHVKDTQVGVKLFRKEILAAILPHIRINRFAFDLELLVLARLFHYKHIIESPVKIQLAFQSTINMRAVLETLYDTIQLYFRERKLKPISVLPSSGISISVLQPHAEQQEQARTRELA